MNIEEIQEDHFYHIYNRGNNGGEIFFEEENYRYFLELLQRYVIPVADDYAYCLLKNHFHLLVRIKNNNEIVKTDLSYRTVNQPKVINASKQISHFFNAYSQAINKRFSRTGSLFEKPFERKIIKDENYLKQTLIYIHNNPVKHGLVSNASEYKWSSYNSFISSGKTKLRKQKVLDIFGDVENFISCHQNPKILNLPY